MILTYCHCHPLSLLSLSPSLFSLVFFYNLNFFAQRSALSITLSHHCPLLQSIPLLPWSSLLSFLKNCKDSGNSIKSICSASFLLCHECTSCIIAMCNMNAKYLHQSSTFIISPIWSPGGYPSILILSCKRTSFITDS